MLFRSSAIAHQLHILVSSSSGAHRCSGASRSSRSRESSRELGAGSSDSAGETVSIPTLAQVVPRKRTRDVRRGSTGRNRPSSTRSASGTRGPAFLVISTIPPAHRFLFLRGRCYRRSASRSSGDGGGGRRRCGGRRRGDSRRGGRGGGGEGGAGGGAGGARGGGLGADVGSQLGSSCEVGGVLQSDM